MRRAARYRNGRLLRQPDAHRSIPEAGGQSLAIRTESYAPSPVRIAWFSQWPSSIDLRPDEDKKLLVVHQQDIQAVVNALWKGGAEAVTIAGLQKLEHYCIAAWGTVKSMAQECGEQQLAKAMERALEEGYEWDREMTRLAEQGINREALSQGGQA